MWNEWESNSTLLFFQRLLSSSFLARSQLLFFSFAVPVGAIGGDYLRLTSKGMLVADAVCAALLEG